MNALYLRRSSTFIDPFRFRRFGSWIFFSPESPSHYTLSVDRNGGTEMAAPKRRHPNGRFETAAPKRRHRNVPFRGIVHSIE